MGKIDGYDGNKILDFEVHPYEDGIFENGTWTPCNPFFPLLDLPWIIKIRQCYLGKFQVDQFDCFWSRLKTSLHSRSHLMVSLLNQKKLQLFGVDWYWWFNMFFSTKVSVWLLKGKNWHPIFGTIFLQLLYNRFELRDLIDFEMESTLRFWFVFKDKIENQFSAGGWSIWKRKEISSFIVKLLRGNFSPWYFQYPLILKILGGINVGIAL